MTEFIKNTLSLCPKCLEIISAKILVNNSIVYLSKNCTKHGTFESKHIWESDKFYRKMLELPAESGNLPNGLVLNLTNECNLSCPFCYSRANDVVQTRFEITQINKLLLNFKGEIVYLSGGEPTTYDNLTEVIRLIKIKGFKVGVFTNGKRFADRLYVEGIKKAGVDFVILQFDSLFDGKYEILRGEQLLKAKMQAIENLINCKIPVYLFVMLVNGVNINEIGDLVRFALKRREAIKIINFNPVWNIGRVAGHGEFGSSMIVKAIEQQTGVNEEDLLESTEFAYYFSRILIQMRGKHLNTQPRCELRCYVFADGDQILALGDLIDVKRINFILKEIFDVNNSNFRLLLGILYFVPHMLFILWKAFLNNDNFRKLIRVSLRNALINICSDSNSLWISPFISIIIGNFPTAYSIDFDFVKTCNLYSDFPGANNIFPACARQIIVDSLFKDGKLSGIVPKASDMTAHVHQ